MNLRFQHSLPLALAALIASCQGSMQPVPMPEASLEIQLSSVRGSASEPVDVTARVINHGPVPLRFEACSMVRWALVDPHGATIYIPHPVVDCAPPQLLSLDPGTRLDQTVRFEGRVYCPGGECEAEPGAYTVIARFAFEDPPLEVRGNADFQWVVPGWVSE